MTRAGAAGRTAVLVLGALIAAVLGWGYWHVSSHGALQLSLYDVALKNERQAYGPVLAAGVVLEDAAGAVLARGRAEGPLGSVSITHPQVGDCRREEREASSSRESMQAWQRCFDTTSRWLITWVPRVRYAGVDLGRCRIERTPVAIDEFRDAWWLWWLPLPHIGGPPYTYFSVSAWIDSRSCRAARREGPDG